MRSGWSKRLKQFLAVDPTFQNGFLSITHKPTHGRQERINTVAGRGPHLDLFDGGKTCIYMSHSRIKARYEVRNENGEKAH